MMDSQDKEGQTLPTGTLLYRFNGVPVVAQASFWPIPVMLIAFLAWMAGVRNPKRNWLQRLGVALLAAPVALFAEIGHAMAHTISARMAGAPMDEIFLYAGLTRTLYENNAVPPGTHILRSLGGPIFSLTGFTLSLLWKRSSTPGTLNRDLADTSLAGHSVIFFGSLVPLPMFDSGIILRWKLVEAGRTPEQADQTVRRTSLGLGAVLLGLGALLGFGRKRKRPGAFLAACGAAAIAAGMGWLK